MNTFSFASFLTINTLVGMVICIASIYSAWANLLENRITKYGFDALILAIGSLIDSNQSKKIRQDLILTKRMGVIMLLFSIGAMYALLLEFKK